MSDKDNQFNSILTEFNHIKEIQKTTAETINHITISLAKDIERLIYRCGSLEALQVRLFSILAETNPTIHKQVMEEIKDSLKDLESKEEEVHSSFVDHLQAIIVSNPGKKVHLKPVLKRIK